MSTSTKVCSIVGCDKPSKRSFSRDRILQSIIKSGLRVKEPRSGRDARSRKVYLCADHWKVVKKVFKKETRPERMRWGH